MKSRILPSMLGGILCCMVAGFMGEPVPAMAASRGEPDFAHNSPETVGEAQGILQHLGYLKGGAYQRGVVDATTRDALMDFQYSHALRPTGRVDSETLTQLLQHRPATDGDGDGVPDVRDKCPNTPRGAKVDAHGCPKDADGDGVADGLDKCPDTPRGAKVNADGCTADSDGDGVTDDKDRCPDTPRGTRVDAHGCTEQPEPAPDPVPLPVGTTLVLEGVNFETSSARLTSASLPILDRVVDRLKANPEVRVEVAGHTDSTGTAAVNDQLSKARADSVRDYLASRGAAASRMETKGYGSSRPIADNGTAAGRAQNRRVELKRID